METALITGKNVPEFDKNIAAWYQKARHHHPDDPSEVFIIGFRNQDQLVYRYITVRGKGQYFDTISFLEQSGFLPLPTEVALQVGLDQVYHHNTR